MTQFEEKEVLRWKDGEAWREEDDVVVESSLKVVVNDKEIITLLCSPKNRRELALGYLRSEGLIENREEVTEIELRPQAKTIFISLKESSVDLAEYFARKRVLTSSCGRASAALENVENMEIGDEESELFGDPEEFTELMKKLHRGAKLFQRTGGSHTAGISDGKELLYLMEDIGRHNAVDKAIGKAFLSGKGLSETVLLTSGRLSSEMVLKAIKSDIPIVVSRSAATTLAVRMARVTNLTLIGFTRGNRLTVYSGEDRLEGLNWS